MRIRPARPEDAEALARLERECFASDAWGVDAVLQEIEGPQRRALVACDAGGGDDVALGWAVTRHVDDVVDLQRVAVGPRWRRRGVARALLEEARRRAREDGAHRMLLEVSEANADARAFYAAEGFVEIDRRRRYYRDGSDALVLRAPLRAGCGGRG